MSPTAAMVMGSLFRGVGSTIGALFAGCSERATFGWHASVTNIADARAAIEIKPCLLLIAVGEDVSGYIRC
jgi:hypothetical protein